MKRVWLLLLAVLTTQVVAVVPTSATDVEVARLAGADRVGTAIAVSERRSSADVAVLANAGDFADALAGVPLAASLDAPLLLTPAERLDERVEDELDRLGVSRVLLLGGPRSLSPAVEVALGDREVERISGSDRSGTSIAIADRLLPSARAYVTSAFSFPDALAVGALAASQGVPVLLLLPGAPETVRSFLDDHDIDEIIAVGGRSVLAETDLRALERPTRTITRVAGDGRYDTAAAVADLAVADGAPVTTVWLADGSSFPDSLAAGPVAGTEGVLLLVDGDRPWATRPAAERLRSWQPSEVVVVGGTNTITASAPHQILAVVTGPELPRGGHALYPHHRLVAFYGHHSSPTLGVLGEQPPDEAYARLWEQAAPYQAGGRPLLPVFELIVSVATAGPGPDGDYSAPSTHDQIRPWLDAARRHGAYLLLDLQSGRTDFLTEAKRYEALLREPDVGLALDPEWRMGPGEVPGKTVGSVDASEVNQVSAWLANIVREERLPQKLLVLHQFQLRMITNRHLLTDHDELALTIQMDGQGSRAAKLDTYGAITREPGPWRMGFKLFYDEDPDMFSPADVLGLRPEAFFVSYQ